MRLNVLVLVLVLLLPGCALTLDTTTIGVPVSLASEAGPAPAGEPFRVTKRAVYLLWGLIQTSQPSLQKELSAQLVGGKAITNVRIKVRSRLTDILITGLTLGLVVPRAVTYEGVVVNQ